MTVRGLAAETRWMDATAQADLVRTEQVKPVELVEAAIERVVDLNPTLNAVVAEWFEHARTMAAEPKPEARFGGVPFLLKDFMAPYAGQPAASNGNRRLKDLARLAPTDSTAVARLRAAGLITIGRTNTPEFASQPTTEPTAWGATRNPWNPAYSAGGSSGGAAAAVAAGMVPFAHASDGSGSIRIPAACCGLVGLKPSRGRVSAGPSGDESGPAVELCVSRSVRDTAALLDALQGPGVGDLVTAPPPIRPYTAELTHDPRSLRVGVLDRGPGDVAVHPDCVAAVRDAAGLLEELGHRVDISWPSALLDTPVDDASPLGLAATSPMANSFAHLAELLGRDVAVDDVESVTWARLQRLREIGAVEVARAQAASARYRRDVHQWWADGNDLLLTPTTAEPPPPLGYFGDNLTELQNRTKRFVAFTRPFNITGQPAITIPMSRATTGLPVGVQLVAAYGREDLLISVAAQLERARPWDGHRPGASAN